jgi:heterodisulfide reductase subunit A-like polyferredoxin
VEYCPVEYPDKFNQEISNNKAVHVYFAQAIPLVTYIDESCLYLKEKKCGICANVCGMDAIDFNQYEEKMEVSVGAVVLSPGVEPFDPKVMDEYRYGEFANVVTSMDYELGPGPPPKNSLDSMRRLEAGQRGSQQLLFIRLLHLYPEAGNINERTRR